MFRRIFVLFSLAAIYGLSAACGQTEHLQGKALYTTHCANCHLDEGTGVGQLIPPLAGSDWLRDNQADATRSLRYGQQGEIVVNGVTYDHVMPANQELTDFQIVNIMNYINQAWGNDYGTVTVAEAREWLGPQYGPGAESTK